MLKPIENMQKYRNKKGQYAVRHWEYIAIPLFLFFTFICYRTSIAKANEYDDDKALFPDLISPISLDEIYGIPTATLSAKTNFNTATAKDYPIPEATKSLQVAEIQVQEYQISRKTKDCIKNHPEIAEKIKTIFPDEIEYAYDLVCRESSFNKEAINPTSGACGLAQSLPCNKMINDNGCKMEDADCQLNWMKKYIISRYKTVKNAVMFHNEHNWY